MDQEIKIMPCLDMQNGSVVKGVHFVDIRDAGDPVECARAYCDPVTLIREVSTDELESIKVVISQFFPGLHRCSITSEVCMYTMTPDGHFYLGKRPGSNLVFGVALAGHGFKFAPVLGEILADLMVDRRPAIDIKLFSPNRFNPEKQTRRKGGNP